MPAHTPRAPARPPDRSPARPSDEPAHELHPDVRRLLGVLAAAAPAAARRAGAVLEVLLADVQAASRGACGAYAWQASRLCGDGFPLEVAFTSATSAIRFTVEPASPTRPAACRLPHALALVEAHAGALDPAARRRLERIQSGARETLRYGAWIGGRVDATGPPRLKLYVEVPEEPPDAVLGAQLRMWGYDLASGTHERYYRVAGMTRAHLRHLLNRGGLGNRSGDLLALLERARTRHPFAERLPGGSAGLSYAHAPDGTVTCTLFLFARALWGGDRRIRHGLLELADAEQWALPIYAAASRPLAAHDVHRTYHGMVGFAVAPGRPLHTAIGLRPPPLFLSTSAGTAHADLA